MEAKDTVMSDDAIKDIVLKHYEANPKLWDGIISIRIGDDLEVAKAQAEISFKAGIREVVEWIQNTGNWVCIDKTKEQWEIIRKEWQAKLKEWGIE